MQASEKSVTPASVIRLEGGLLIKEAPFDGIARIRFTEYFLSAVRETGTPASWAKLE